jgi:hypothetical protein
MSVKSYLPITTALPWAWAEEDHMTEPDTTQTAPMQPAYLTTLERQQALQATAIKPALDEATTFIAQALRADKVDTFLYDPARTSLVAVGTSRTPMGQRQQARGLDRLALANGGRSVEVFQTGGPYILDRSRQTRVSCWAYTRGLGSAPP